MNLNALLKLLLAVLLVPYTGQDKLNLDALNNYSEFLNFGVKKVHHGAPKKLENAIFKSKLDVLGEVFKKNVQFFKVSDKLDIVFLVDASSSVGGVNFKSELRFIKKLLSDITVDYNHTRVAVVTFSSPSDTVKNIDGVAGPSEQHNKCLLLNEQLMNIEYKGGETYTAGAFQKAKEIFDSSNRNDSKKVVILVTDGYSSGENPVPFSNELKLNHVTVFTIGIRNGNYKELYELSSNPGEFYSYLLDSFEEFESLARRALHVDLSGGDYLPLGKNKFCDKLCEHGDCCDDNAICTCGTTTGHYSCVCAPGFYGSGLRNDCMPCTAGTYSDGPNLCLPCPDVHHTTTPPATGLRSCTCKKGFQSTSAGTCQILKCPKLEAPPNGYIVKKKECSNVLNSACGVRCEVGYILVGGSIRLCQENATWSGSDPTCEVKTCSKLPIPKFGMMKCEQTDLGVVYNSDEVNLPVDTVCNFECQSGTLQIGSKQRVCLPIAQWDGLRTICKPIKCNKLPPLKYGKVEPSSCHTGKQEYGKVCTILCQEGFVPSGPVNITCGDHGFWGKNRKSDPIQCTDTTPPNLVCPKNVTGFTVSGTDYGQVNWEEPNITDNSALSVQVWIQPAITEPTDYKFSIGVTPVTYFAQDAFKNAIRCKFFVEILDREPPTIEGCISPPTFLVNPVAPEVITWDEPNIFDNSRNVTVTKSDDFGTFPVGTTEVIYTAKDPSGNVNLCKINITVEESQCPDLPAPPNAQLQCSDQSEGVQCVITCQEGYAIPLQTASSTTLDNSTNFLCNHADAIWYNPDGLLFPECSITVVGEDKLQGSVDLPLPDNVNCNDSQKIVLIQKELESSITNSICTSECDVNVVSECEVEKSEEQTNRLLSRKRRNPPEKQARKKRRKLKLKVQVKGKKLKNFTMPGVNGTVKLDSHQFTCPQGFIRRKNRCVQCPRGTFHNTTTDSCQSCQFGFYNDKVGQTACSACPPHYSTRKMHVKSARECKEMCPPGTHARKKTVKLAKKTNLTVDRATLSPYCKSCPVGTYQSDYGQTGCQACPEGYTTTKTRSASAVDCIPSAAQMCAKGACNRGECRAVGQYQFACHCLPGFVGTYCEKEVSPCDTRPCHNGGTCTYNESTFRCLCPSGFIGDRCQESQPEPCSLTCQNGGTCLELGDNELTCSCPAGFLGDNCEVKVTYCANAVCENNSTCTEAGGTFECVCSAGFMGRRCNIQACDYKPCPVYTVCVSLAVENAGKSDFRCVCPDGLTGTNCTESIDYCAAAPCLNGGECVNADNAYKCLCTPLFSGPNCEFRRETKYILNFTRYDVNDFIRLRGFEQNLTEITACLWMQTVDNFNYGTLLSYATEVTDNAFTLTDYTGLVLYINKQYVVTDVFLNDGHWHHICASWSSPEGFYQIFVDGFLVKNGSNLAANTKIQGHGYLIVGQEQDVMGGRFSQSESFVGRMAYIDLWSKVLSEQEIRLHQNDCSDTMMGDLYAWPEMQEHTNGHIQKLPSTFCQKCEDPKPLYNGFIDLIDSKAFYSCYPGFEISSKQFVNGRQCTKTSKWEGFYEPHCKKIECGYPGQVRNGHFTGNQFSYNSKVTYECYTGFRMSGNPVLHCGLTGWVPEKPKCVGPQCKLPQIQNGDVKIVSQANEAGGESDSVDVDTQIQLICHGNAALIGHPLSTCQEDGTWDNANMSCQTESKMAAKLTCPISQVPKPPVNGYVDAESVRKAAIAAQDFVEYKCLPGYLPIGVNTSTCILDGYWTDPNVTCQAAVTCPSPPQFPHMSPKEPQGDTLTYACADGYAMTGNGTIRCTTLGKWSEMLGKCSRISCGQPQFPLEAQLMDNRFLYGDQATITCKSTRKSFTVTCLKNGSWSFANYHCTDD